MILWNAGSVGLAWLAGHLHSARTASNLLSALVLRQNSCPYRSVTSYLKTAHKNVHFHQLRPPPRKKTTGLGVATAVHGSLLISAFHDGWMERHAYMCVAAMEISNATA